MSAEPGWLQSCSQEPELPTYTFMFYQKHSHQESAGAWHQLFVRYLVPGNWEDILIFFHHKNKIAMKQGNFNCV